MRIAHVITDLRTGGAQIMLGRLVRRLEALGVGNTVIALRGLEENDRPHAGGGADVYALDMQPHMPSPRALLRLRRMLAAAEADVVHTWLYHADLVGGLAAWLPRRAAIVWGLHHTPHSAERFKPATRAIIRLNSVLSRVLPDRIVCCAHASKDSHVALGYAADKMSVIANGFDTAAFRPNPEARLSVRQELGLAADVRLVSLMARYHPQKDHHNFICGAARLIHRDDGVHFLMAGRGVDDRNGELRAWVDATGRPDRFHLVGERQDMPRLMAASDVVSSSAAYGEGLPLVLGEAMACGVPCVTTDVGDSALLVGHTGRVVRPKDPVGLADAWAWMLALSPGERHDIGARARERIVAEYPMERCVSNYLALYRALSPSRAAAPA